MWVLMWVSYAKVLSPSPEVIHVRVKNVHSSPFHTRGLHLRGWCCSFANSNRSPAKKHVEHSYPYIFEGGERKHLQFFNLCHTYYSQSKQHSRTLVLHLEARMKASPHLAAWDLWRSTSFHYNRDKQRHNIYHAEKGNLPAPPINFWSTGAHVLNTGRREGCRHRTYTER